ncbi:hypothetical protein AMAG_11403 [Allomyces macrogynus ATCC 38327]|uniref:Xaa-Pro dipeptidase n=1 Tax=Allomyces macrogynus (strain ATCC 38327) TaxID=578462 RepID=A0A0L0SWI2_ALLM3|nr:hypothetical protein AMAG_11403 [Allomyces macrogynus ATCC 38327]|eukprot:KNE66928.1 hypothetical protein AMAG_11403 [Allomyces macrogynus ATCC 38327]
MAYPTPSPDVLAAASDLSTPFPVIPAAEHRTQVREALAKAGIESGVVYLRGDVTAERHHTDVEVMFRQESNFLYVTGCEEPGYHYLLDVASGESFLFAPVVELDEAVWIGMPPSLEDQTETYGLPVLGVAPQLANGDGQSKPPMFQYSVTGNSWSAAKEPSDQAVANGHATSEMGEAGLVQFSAFGADPNAKSGVTANSKFMGTFTDEARHIYQTVLNTQIAVIEQLRPGVQWEDMHRVAERVIAQGLIDAGILVGDIEDVLAAHAQAVFLPHGLGHLLGLDVHDVGGYPKGTERIPEPSIRYLRMRRALEPGMVVTVEPGIYFTALVIENAKNDETVAPFIDFDVVERYMPVGGVRIEDNILITEDGYLNLTDVPKTVEEIEAIMADAA